MTDPIDPALRTRLDRLARAVPAEPERLLRPITSIAPRYRGRSSLGVLAAGALILVLAVAAASMGGAPTPSPTRPSPTGNFASMTDRSFELGIRAPKTQYALDEPIDVVATLEYLGPDPSINVSSAPGLLGFGVDQIDGNHGVDPGHRSSCVSSSLVRGQPVSYPFAKSGGYYPEMPDADFVRQYLNIVDGRADPVLRLPTGTWRIFAVTEFAEGGCRGPAHKLEVGITIVVAGANVAASVDPSAAPVVQLPTWSEAPASGACPAALMGRVTLRGDPTSPSRPVWVESSDGDQRNIVWPFGFTARFNPALELLNADGDVVAREGDVLDLGGGVVSSLDPAYDFYACHVSLAWGPLAVIPPQDGTDLARNEGTLRITDACVYLEDPGGDLWLLTWPADRTRWSEESRSIAFENFAAFDGTIVTVGDGDPVVLGGGGSSEAESGISEEEWVRRVDWVSPPAPSCSLDRRFHVGVVSFD